MPLRRLSARASLAALPTLLFTAPAAAQDARHVDRLIAYLAPVPGFTAAERSVMIDWVRRFGEAGLPDTARGRVARVIADAWLRAAGHDTAGLTTTLNGLLARAARGGYRIGPAFDYPSQPTGDLLDVEVRGRGPIAVILIPEFRKNWTIHQPFMDANADRFTSYTFSLPGYGGTLPYPLPPTADYGARVWLDGVATAVERLIERRRLSRPILVGSHDAGTYIAVRVASRRPDLVGGVVSLNGSLYDASLEVPGSAGRVPTAAERAGLVARDPGAMLGGLFVREALRPESVAVLERRPVQPRNPVRYYTRDSVWTQRVYGMHLAFRPFLERYYFEWLTADLRDAVAQLRVPLVAIPSSADDEAPQRSDRSTHVQWARLVAEHPAASVQVVPFEEVRGLVAVDAPLEVGDAISALAAGRPVKRRDRTSYPRRTSPRASVSQSIGAGTVTVSYGRLHANADTSRPSIPLDSLWNPGADEATIVTFSHAATIGGIAILAGRYSLLARPGRDRWTLMFNRAADRWETTEYVPSLDAAVLSVAPASGARVERLTYLFEETQTGSVELVLRFDGLVLRVPIAIP